MTTLHISQSRDGDMQRVTLAGPMDEDAPYDAIAWQGAKGLAFDCAGITLINSTGLQKWVRFLETLPTGMPLTFARCPVRMVNQVNMFSGFFAQRPVTITSFQAPYYCARCDASHVRMLDVAAAKPDLRHDRAPAQSCPTCQGAMEFDGLERKYFLFVRMLGLA